MNNINNILIAVELDELSESVIEYGITLGLMLDANVRCLHVSRPLANKIIYDETGELNDDFSDMLDAPETYDLDEIIEQDLEKLRSMILNVLDRMKIDDLTVMPHVRSDFAVAGIIKEAEETAADLIVIGAHVDYIKKDRGVGNLSRSIIDKTEKSIVVVPSTYGNRNLDHMCMFVNFEFEELTMIQDMIEVAISNEVHLSFIHIVDKNERVVDIEKKIRVYQRLFLKDEDHSYVSFTMKTGAIENIIDDLTNDMDVDFIGLKTKKKHWNLFGLQQAYDSRVLNNIKVPLYIWRQK